MGVNRALPRLRLSLCLALLGGCGLAAKWFPKKAKPGEDTAKKEIFIGTIELVRGALNPALEIEGILLTMFDRAGARQAAARALGPRP